MLIELYDIPDLSTTASRRGSCSSFAKVGRWKNNYDVPENSTDISDEKRKEAQNEHKNNNHKCKMDIEYNQKRDIKLTYRHRMK